MATNDDRLRRLLGEVFDRMWEDDREQLSDYDRLRNDFIFHLTDVSGNVEQWSVLIQDPDRMDTKAATTFFVGLLYHMIPHMKAAGRLLLETVPDPFEETTAATSTASETHD